MARAKLLLRKSFYTMSGPTGHSTSIPIRLQRIYLETGIHEMNASRIAHRVMKGGHDVPIAKIISRYEKSILNCLELSQISK